MIIGISGKAQSGKDTVAKIFQYYTIPKPDRLSITIQEWVNEMTYHPSIHSKLSTFLENKSYADKLKDCASIMLGIPRNRLDLESVKASILPNKWDRWKLTIRGFASPKFFATQALAQNYARENALGHYYIDLQKMTVRLFLQELGTEAMRDSVHPNIHINALYNDYLPEGHTNLMSKITDTILRRETFPSWVITDVRMRNELVAVKHIGPDGRAVKLPNDDRFILRVNRPGMPSHDKHVSETGLDDYKAWDAVITNNCSMNELADRVLKVIKDSPIISQYFHI